MLDEQDINILSALQNNALITAQKLGKTVNLSPSQVTRRKQKLEARGYIFKVAAHLDPVRLGLNVQAFVVVTMKARENNEADTFQQYANSIPEVVGAWKLTGEAEYLLRVYCRDIAHLNYLVNEVILCHDRVAKTQSEIVMQQAKFDSPLPIMEDAKNG